ncbi:MAG: hypothetical protein QOD42_408 [Sphingomonadales bacterium]|jgi:phytanoyl-CoA hydroxylase|nr:hypothetical protein [Sphingomonadales bacterium]
MLELTSLRGFPVSVPESAAEDPSPRFTIGQDAEIAAYYEENGYVIVRALIDAKTCDEMRAIWDNEVKPSKAFLYRQRSSRPERHDIGESGFVMNAVANVQSVDPRTFGRLRDFGTGQILTSPNLIAVFRALIKGKPKLVNSMYFEGNEGSLDHRDGYYFESENLGAMAAAWVALEDIRAGAGRFFISPRSHRFAFPESARDPNLLLEHDVYIKDVLAGLREGGYEYRAPGLEKGDVLFWHGWTILARSPPATPLVRARRSRFMRSPSRTGSGCARSRTCRPPR